MRALKALFLIWTNPKKGLVRKRVLQRDAFEGETYYEAVPTTAILTAMLGYFLLWDLQNPDKVVMSLGLTNGLTDEQTDDSSSTLHLVTFFSSILSAIFGLSKTLVTGPCKIFPGTSLFSGRVLLLVFANLFNLLGSLIIVVGSAAMTIQVNSPLKVMIIQPKGQACKAGIGCEQQTESHSGDT